jgi:hypothetical protein
MLARKTKLVLFRFQFLKEICRNKMRFNFRITIRVLLWLISEFLFVYIIYYWQRAGRFGDRITVGAKFFAPVQTGPGTHPASCANGYRVFLGGKERPECDADP